MPTRKLSSFSIKEQARLIVEAFAGSFMVEAMFEELQTKAFCQKIVNKFRGDYDDDDCDVVTDLLEDMSK